MASSVNKVILVGNLGRDPEARTFQGGGKIVNLRVATSETWRDKNSGERRERTEWHAVVIKNEHLAKVAEQYARKGSKVYVEGQIETRKWTDKDGHERYSTEVVVPMFRGEFKLLDGRNDDVAEGRGDSRGGNAGRQQSGARGGQSAGGAAGGGPALDDDIPF
ncbi:single-stranded DNA-binding protein [Sphingobium sp.]|uniref:single-stranded DNA-binding protein n=1 Tax=Sphingobium sp. TaxID=1912891 RepID=UPI002CF8C6C3|nr:single-stranded DNA-binding protein [Sphingobium sp.]HUD90589.1 single-stranded DNA-binding protein [Sphingobium sp.]